MKLGDGNEPLDAFVRQTAGKESYLSFSRTGETPIRWIQLLHDLDQQELPGWPSITPLKIQMQKCEKCSQEFCSLVNYRRHIRVHRRSLNVDKVFWLIYEPHKIRDMLASFWDKLFLEDAKEVVSFRDVIRQDVPWSSVVKTLAASLCKPAIWTLPEVYVKAGSVLLDIVCAKPSRFPISSKELFSILDDASEGTFLCAGTAESVQKYVFDGEVGKIGLDMKNLVASTGFLVEQKLVKAWLADKDAESLRHQKLLVEEEEAAQKRQAELLERKKQKKLRQKERKAREQLNVAPDASEGSLLAAPSPLHPSDLNSDAPNILADVTSCIEPIKFSNDEENGGVESQFDLSTKHSSLVPCVEPSMVSVNAWRLQQLPKSQRARRNRIPSNQNLRVLKPETVQKHVLVKDPGTIVSSSKAWTKKFKVENGEESLRPKLEETVEQTNENKCEIAFGSIPVNYMSPKKQISLGGALQSYSIEPGKHKKNTAFRESANINKLHSGANRAATEFWRPVSRNEISGSSPVQRPNNDSGDGFIFEKLEDRTASNESCLRSSAWVDEHSKCTECSTSMDQRMRAFEGLQLASGAAKAFLARRWEKAVSEEHATVVLSTEPEPPGCPQTQNDSSVNVNFENQLRDAVHFWSTDGDAKVKVRTNLDNVVKIEYTPT